MSQDRACTSSGSDTTVKRLSAADKSSSLYVVCMLNFMRSRLTCTGKYPISMRRFIAADEVFCNPIALSTYSDSNWLNTSQSVRSINFENSVYMHRSIFNKIPLSPYKIYTHIN